MTQHREFLSIEKQIEHLSSKGVSFQLISKEGAKKYLDKHNNYFRLRPYRKCFAKVVGGIRDGQYIGLDFAMLIDMSIIDMLLRYELLLTSGIFSHTQVGKESPIPAKHN